MYSGLFVMKCSHAYPKTINYLCPLNFLKMLDRTIAPTIVDAVHFNLKLQPYEKYILKNGVEVYTIDAGAEAVLQIEWVFDAGNWHEEKNLEAAITNFLLKNGTTFQSAFQISEHFEYYGAHLNRSCGAEFANVTLHTLTKHLPKLLPIVREILSEATLPQTELDIAVQNMKQKLNLNLKKSSFVAARMIGAQLFGLHHPYGRYSTHDDFDALTREALCDFYQLNYKEGAFKIFVAGKLPPYLKSLLETHFGDFANVKKQGRQYTIRPSEQRKHRITNDEKSSQGSIRLARSFGNRHHPDFLKAQVLNVVLGGFFGSRLMANIREDKGYTYGIHSYLLGNKKENGWMITTEAGREVCEASIEEIYKEMERLRNEPVDQEELMLVKNYMMGSILGDLNGPFQMIARWKNIIMNELDNNFFDNYIANIKNITAATLQETANTYLLPNDFYELVVY